MADQQGSMILWSPLPTELGLQACTVMPSYLYESWGIELRPPQALMLDQQALLPTEPSHSPFSLLLYVGQGIYLLVD